MREKEIYKTIKGTCDYLLEIIRNNELNFEEFWGDDPKNPKPDEEWYYRLNDEQKFIEPLLEVVELIAEKNRRDMVEDVLTDYYQFKLQDDED